MSKNIMQYGKYKGYQFEAIPRDYLNYMYDNGAIKDEALESYVLQNYDKIMNKRMGSTDIRYFPKYKIKTKRTHK